MKIDFERIKLLGLTRKEIRVLDALREGKDTPLLIAECTRVSRPGVYEILDRLHARGLAKSHIKDGKTYWTPAKDRDIETKLYETKRALLNIEEGVEEVRGVSDSTVIVHRGAPAILKLMDSIIKENKDERLYAIQGDIVIIGWNKIFGVEKTNELNRYIKKNHIITEAIVPSGWFERQTKLQGKKWAENFEGRMAVTHVIGEDYFNHGGQIWAFKNSLYLISMNEELIIEIRNSEIQKLILSMFQFIQDNSRKIDVNALLRDLIAKM